MWDLGCVCVCLKRRTDLGPGKYVVCVRVRACVSKRHTQMWDLGRHPLVAVLRSCRNLDPTNLSSLGADDADKETFRFKLPGSKTGAAGSPSLLGAPSPGRPGEGLGARACVPAVSPPGTQARQSPGPKHTRAPAEHAWTLNPPGE